MPLRIVLALLALSSVHFAIAAYGPCPLKGQAFLAPTAPSASTPVQSAKAAILATITAALGNGTTPFGQINGTTTSFSVNLFSTHEDTPILTYHHDAPLLANPSIGVSNVDSNTIYRIGSISKLLSVYIYLVSVGDVSYNDPITKYIPEFAEYARQNPVKQATLDTWDFNSMTVGSLAGQLSGLPRETVGGFFELDQLEQLGLPMVPEPPPDIIGSTCNNTYHIACTRATFLQNILGQKPILPSFAKPAYSNVAYGIFGLVLENITGQDLSDLFQSKLVQPLDLNATYYAAPPTPDEGIIPYNDSVSYWTTNIANLSAAGNYYSSTNDMEKIGRSILTSELLSPTQTRSWLRPVTFADRSQGAVGAPWEIYLGPASVGRQSWLFVKQGDIGTYSTTIALSPDHDFSFTVLTAGLDCVLTNQYISDIVAEYMLPAMEQAAMAESGTNSAGTYRNDASNSTVVLAVDNKPGLAMPTWTVNGTDMTVLFDKLLGDTSGAYFRLYPSGLKSADGSQIGYRVVAYTNGEKDDNGTLSTNCFEWTSIDSLPYGGPGLDDFAFHIDSQTGKTMAVEPRSFRDPLPRTS